MVTVDEAARLALDLPEVTEGERTAIARGRSAIVDGWLACAPPTLADEYVEQERRAARRR